MRPYLVVPRKGTKIVVIIARVCAQTGTANRYYNFDSYHINVCVCFQRKESLHKHEEELCPV